MRGSSAESRTVARRPKLRQTCLDLHLRAISKLPYALLSLLMSVQFLAGSLEARPPWLSSCEYQSIDLRFTNSFKKVRESFDTVRTRIRPRWRRRVTRTLRACQRHLQLRKVTLDNQIVPSSCVEIARSFLTASYFCQLCERISRSAFIVHRTLLQVCDVSGGALRPHCLHRCLRLLNAVPLTFRRTAAVAVYILEVRQEARA